MGIIHFETRQWATTERSPLVLARIQPRATRLIRASLVAAPAAPLRSVRWPDTRGEIHDTRPDILIDGPVHGPRPMPIIERCAPSAPSCKGYCGGQSECETPAICAGGDTAPRMPRKPRPLTGQQVGEAAGNALGWGLVLALGSWGLVLAVGHLVARWL